MQARLGSSRLPGKVLLPLAGKPMLWHIVDRLRRAPGVTTVGVATSDLPGDAPLRDFCRAEGIPVFAGDERDVLDRFYRATSSFGGGGDPVLRVTGDCPFVDPELVGRLLAQYHAGAYDHFAVATGAVAHGAGGARYPDGLDVECIRLSALERAWREATAPSDREHVTPYLYRVAGRFRNGMLPATEDHGGLRWTVDHAADFAVVERVYAALWRADRPFLMSDILAFFAEHPELRALNDAFVGQEGYSHVWNPK
ncbi:MAG TPA: glycosyltransferase family protein [Polyangia bacterium]|nr:glycosyltransferase family protein [Polyangia bacterium]